MKQVFKIPFVVEKIQTATVFVEIIADTEEIAKKRADRYLSTVCEPVKEEDLATLPWSFRYHVNMGTVDQIPEGSPVISTLKKEDLP